MHPASSRRALLSSTAGLLLGSMLPTALAQGGTAATSGTSSTGGASGATAAGTATAAGAASKKAPPWNGPKLKKLVLAGPYALVSNPLIRIVDSGALNDVAEQVEFVSWRTPDQLRAMAIKGEVDFLAVPSNVAANLYNRGVKLRLMNIGVWGILWVLSRDGSRKTLADLKGEEIVMPFRGDMPDFIFRLVAKKQGIDVGRDMKLRYVASPLDAMQLLITRRADNALLAEPAISVGLRKTQSFPISAIAPELHRGVNLQAEWGKVFNTEPRIPQAGIIMLGQQLDNAALATRFQQACIKAADWCEKNPDECGKAVAARVDALTPEGVADAIRAEDSPMTTAADAKDALKFFYEQLRAHQPGLIGGKLPPDDFYYSTAP
ncbi:MAG: ABC transporter substrate-binding protein [Lautropia sp.]|nr:ABC transporter substrate-binding protein [Lautropia sp.]